MHGGGVCERGIKVDVFDLTDLEENCCSLRERMFQKELVEETLNCAES